MVLFLLPSLRQYRCLIFKSQNITRHLMKIALRIIALIVKGFSATICFITSFSVLICYLGKKIFSFKWLVSWTWRITLGQSVLTMFFGPKQFKMKTSFWREQTASVNCITIDWSKGTSEEKEHNRWNLGAVCTQVSIKCVKQPPREGRGRKYIFHFT